MESLGVLRYTVTQNVDNLHTAAGNENVAEIHGQVALKVRCLQCGERFPREAVSYDELPPRCLLCNGVVKNDWRHVRRAYSEST